MNHVLAFTIIGLLILLAGCAAMHYQTHPGSLNTMDSAAYDALLVAETTIDQARSDVQAGELPAGAKDALNKLIALYNLARESWLTYRGAVSANVPAQPYLDQLNKNLSDLGNAIRSFQEAK